MNYLVRCLLLVIIPVGVFANPPVNTPRVGLANIVESGSLLACEFTPAGLKVEGFQSADSTPTDPQPGDPCLPLLGKVAAINQPDRVGGYPGQVARLRPDALASILPSLVWPVIQGGHLVEIVGCSMDPAIGDLIVTSSASGDAEPPVTAPVGQHCLKYLAGRTQGNGASLSPPVAVALNPGFAGTHPGDSLYTGVLFLLIPQSAAGGQAKALRCDRDALGGLTTTYLERSGEEHPDASALGRPCLEALAEEQNLPGKSEGLQLQLVGPWPVPDIEECLIFDFGAGG